MRKKILSVFAVGLMLVCSGCGSDKSDVNVSKNELVYDSYEADWEAETAGGFSENYSAAASDTYYQSAATTEEAMETAAENGKYTDGNTAGTAQTKENGTGKIDKEMLVYRGELSIDTLDFNISVSNFKTLINEKGGFIESESYTDNYSNSSYYAIDKSNKHNLYTATVRVPSSAYDEVMNSATNLGDVRSRYSNASNVTQQYSTYKSQLEIYETEYNRYLTLLESATDDEYALMIENELFDIQIQIANLKSGMTNIENDVAYSYIDITIKEVSEYEEEPEKTDTFFDRFKNTCKDSWDGFLEAMEDLLFWIVMNVYGIIIFVVIVLLVWRFWRKKRGKKVRRNKKVQNMAEGQMDNRTAQNISGENKEKEKAEKQADNNKKEE